MEFLGLAKTAAELFETLCPELLGLSIGAGFMACTLLSLVGYGIFKALSLINIS